MKNALTQGDHKGRPLRVGIVFTAFPVKKITPYKYFILLLNTLQKSCQFELFDIRDNDRFIEILKSEMVDMAPGFTHDQINSTTHKESLVDSPANWHYHERSAWSSCNSLSLRMN